MTVGLSASSKQVFVVLVVAVDFGTSPTPKTVPEILRAEEEGWRKFES